LLKVDGEEEGGPRKGGMDGEARHDAEKAFGGQQRGLGALEFWIDRMGCGIQWGHE
jgi:hypothetical protein